MPHVEFLLIHKDAALPEPMDSGWDIAVSESVVVPARQVARVRTGCAIGIPEGYVGMLYERMHLVLKQPYQLLCPVIHTGFDAEVSLMVYNLSDKPLELRKYDKIAQLLAIPVLPYSQPVMTLTSRKRQHIGHSGYRTHEPSK